MQEQSYDIFNENACSCLCLVPSWNLHIPEMRECMSANVMTNGCNLTWIIITCNLTLIITTK